MSRNGSIIRAAAALLAAAAAPPPRRTVATEHYEVQVDDSVSGEAERLLERMPPIR